jgi:hypothetical protein
VLRARRHDGRGYGGLVPPFALPWSTPGGDLVVPFFCPGGSLSCHGETVRVAVESAPSDVDNLLAAFPHWRPSFPRDAALAQLDPARPLRADPLPYSPWGDLVPAAQKHAVRHVGTVVVDLARFRAAPDDL